MSTFRVDHAACTFRVQSAVNGSSYSITRAVQSSDDCQFIGKETVMRYLKVLIVHICGVTEEN